MSYEDRMDAASDYLAEHYQDCIENEDICNYLNEASFEEVLEFQEILTERYKELFEQAKKQQKEEK